MKKNKIAKRKSQIRIQEMAFMLVGVFLFFGLVILFALTLLYSKIQNEARQIAEERTLSSIVNLADSPEFYCGGYSRINCVDFDKAMALSNNKKYQNFWPYSSLEIQKLSAFNKDKDEMIICTKQNYPNCERLIIYNKSVRNERRIDSFVALCRVESEASLHYQKCEIAKFVAGTELKNIKK
ncbi:MAG: hypothetical protein QXW97_03990 [Candidatus Pacearchaeota archaeon]